MDSIVNVDLLKHPMNWVTILGMLAMLFFFVALVDPYAP